MTNLQQKQHYFFCGIGGSGMMPLALILKAGGHTVSGSDRSYDQGKTPEKFLKLTEAGITLCAQDGSGISQDITTLVVSGAIEDSVPDVAAAKEMAIPIQTRATILASMFNTYNRGISVAGTSGKSTTTGMIATILHENGLNPTVMNGGMISNFTDTPFPNMRAGDSDIFVTETDESDGSIALYNPAIAVLNNIALDHMPLETLKIIFTDFIDRAQQAAILNMDDPHIRDIAKNMVSVKKRTYAIDHDADLRAQNIRYTADGVQFDIDGNTVQLRVPGRHNVLNAMAAMSAAMECGLTLEQVIKAIQAFTGIGRRLQVIGTKNDMTVIDDFAHNPDKIAASLQTLKNFDGRLLVMFQMHGFGPIQLMGKDIIAAFAEHLSCDDQLIMPEVYYAGGTVDRSQTAKDMIADAQDSGVQAHWFQTRAEAGDYIGHQAEQGDRIVIMGARDDTLTVFAQEILAAL